MRGLIERTHLSGLALCLALLAPAVQADMIGPEHLAGPAAVSAERSRIDALITRPGTAKQLQVLGVPPEEALMRVNAMSDEEVHKTATQLDALPAGGNLNDFQAAMTMLLSILAGVVQ
jgi:hypothetical protein